MFVSTTPSRPPDDPGMAEGLEQATADLAARMSGKSAPPPAGTAPPPETPPTETPPAETPPSAEPPTPPSPAAAPVETPPPSAPGTEPPPATPATPEVLPPDAQRLLDMYGGDRDKAWAAAVRNNNRLAAIAKAHPELFTDGAPGDPNAPPPEIPELFQDPTPEPLVPVEEYVPDQNEVLQAVNSWVDEDPRCRTLMHDFAQNDSVINEKRAEQEQLKQDIEYKQRLLKDPSLMPDDDLRKADIQAEVRSLRYDHGNLGHEIRGLEDDNRRMDEEFLSRRAQARDAISENMEQSYAEEAIDQEAQQVEDTTATGDQPLWRAAVDRAIANSSIPADQVSYFRATAKAEALAHLAQSEEVSIDNYDTFLAPIAKREAERIDSAHRSQAAVYGAQAHVRATTPAPPSAPGTATPPPPGQPEDLDSIMHGVRTDLRDRMRG